MNKHTSNMIANGNELGVWKRLMIKEVIAPNIIFKLPISAEALPALVSKGSKDKAVVLGF